MSECVVRMELPAEHCMDCRYMVSRDNDDCILQSDEANEQAQSWEDLKAGCPFVAVLPEKHGRLVDADAEIKHHLDDFEAFEAEHGKEKTYGKLYSINDLWIGITEAFDTADIIVPATEGGNHEAD